MYLTKNAVIGAINILRPSTHPFLGITYLACKRHGLAVGSAEPISMDNLTKDHMDEFHRIDRRSSFYFQPFRGGPRLWVNRRYPSTGLQTINTQTFLNVFMHQRGTNDWGFRDGYVSEIVKTLEERRLPTKVPALSLAVWLYKDRLTECTNYLDLLDLFYADFKIGDEERELLFDRSSAGLPDEAHAFSADPLEMTAVLDDLPEPPDAEAEGGRTITSLRLVNAGPAVDLTMNFGSRISIVTGDNGLGKSFLLDFAWWAATGSWAERQALPRQGGEASPSSIEYSLTATSGRVVSFAATFNSKEFRWARPKGAMTIEALAVFSRADGSFSLADPVRRTYNQSERGGENLTAREVWDGKNGFMEGLIRDWARWEATDRETFDLLAAVLKRLSPEDLGTLTPGPTVRLPGDYRDIPTIQHRFGSIPVTHASSGMQRVLLLAYLMIWSWREHEIASEQLGRAPLRRMMVIVDELEAHLHPKWQRIVLPALVSASNLLSGDLALQLIAATHSPMILASMETGFDPSTDVLYHLYGDGPVIRLEETPFVRYGDVSGWLTSPLFGLRHARSREAEQAIEAAKALQLENAPTAESVRDVSAKLAQHLASDDKFWPRWLFFAEQNGVEL